MAGSEIKVNQISPKQTCTTITVGNSGNTIIIPAGATITNNGTANGFGATYNGAINWSSTIKTSGFTAVSGNGYFCNTTSGPFIVTLPASPSAGNVVAFKDYAQTWNTNSLTLGRNGSNIEGIASNAIQSTQGQSITLIYIDSTKGWVIIDSAQSSEIKQPTFITATGGTVLTCGNYKTHIFTSSGCFVVSSIGNVCGSTTVDYMVVAGGGGNQQYGAGGGGAGGFRQSYPNPATGGFPITATTYPITVGAGGTWPTGTNGSPSVFSTITSAGGGFGSIGFGAGPNVPGNPGGSAGGGGSSTGGGSPGGTGNTPPVSPPQGNPGGNGGSPSGSYASGGGGGASASGGNASPGGPAGAGGDGSYWPNGAFGPTAPSYGTTGPVPAVRYFAGGGGGAIAADAGPRSPAPGGAGGGGAGKYSGGPATVPSVAGTANTGGGSGGGDGYSGGSGIVVIRYKYQ
jgi:hypothetical protein